MQEKLPGIAGILVFVVLFAAAVIGVEVWHSKDSDGIEEGKSYALAYTYKTTIKGSALEGRVFDFADRNLSRTSILVPILNEQGVLVAHEDSSLPPSTVRKVRVHVSKKEMEGVTYPAYDYVEWQFHFGVREVQDHVPSVIPRR